MMKRFLFLLTVAVISSSTVVAQKSAVRNAKRALGGNDLNEARTLIIPATTNPETATDPETWKVYGDIGNKAFDNERTNQMVGKQANEKAMYDGLFESYRPYVVADSLGELPDAKGKVKNRFRKDISGILRANHAFYINGGVYYNDQRDYPRASDFFEVYWNIPTLPMFVGAKDAFLIDSTYQTIKYYAIITAIQGQQHERAIGMLRRAANEPFIENSAYKESDLYELLASEYIQIGDSVKFTETLYEGAEKFPQSNYFVNNLVNLLIKRGENNKAMQFLDQAIKNDPTNACELNTVKGALIAETGDFAKAEVEYRKALESDPNCERALESIAVNFIIQAQNIKEETAMMTDRKQQAENDKVTVELYLKALPMLEKYTGLLRARSADKSEINTALIKLQNVYYNLSSLGVDKSKELSEVEAELNAGS